MYQLFAVILSFLCIPILFRLKIKLSKTLFITAGILGLLSGIGIDSIKEAVLSVFIDSSSLSTLLAVSMVTILSGLMKEYGILDKIVESMAAIIKNKKTILMIVPALIGMLIVPGGALLSAPFINNLGEEMDIKVSRRAAINLVFRHIAMFVLPYSTSLLIIAGSMPELSIFKIILYNLVYVIPMTIIGYFMFIKDLRHEEEVSEKKDKGKGLLALLTYTSPIYISVIINLLTGLPFYIALIGSIVLVYLISDKKGFLMNLLKSFNLSTVSTVIAIFIIKGIILRMDELLLIFNNSFAQSNSIFTIMIVFFISSFLFGFITGSQQASMAILLPMISALQVSGETIYVYISFAFACAFVGYFFSPIHLCQAFTVEYMGTSTKEVYSEYKYFPLILVIVSMLSFLILM